jgi:hypothetical protein
MLKALTLIPSTATNKIRQLLSIWLKTVEEKFSEIKDR